MIPFQRANEMSRILLACIMIGLYKCTCKHKCTYKTQNIPVKYLVSWRNRSNRVQHNCFTNIPHEEYTTILYQ